MIEINKRKIGRSIMSGLKLKCPNCDKGAIFGKYLKVNGHCASCNEALHHHRADDAPPYFTIFIVGHIVVPLMIFVEATYRPDLWLHTIIWMPLTVALCYWVLPRVKAALIGYQWAIKMHGFDPEHDEDAEWGGHTGIR